MMDFALKAVPEIRRIARAGSIVASVLREIGRRIEPRVKPRDLDFLCEELVRRAGGTPCMRGFGDYPAASAFSVNDVAAHGVPDERPFAPGDVVTVDVAVDVDGWKADGAWTFLITGGDSEEASRRRRLVNAAWQCSLAGLAIARPPHRIGDVGAGIWRHARRDGYQVVRRFTGHGVGRSLHEEPTFHYAEAAGYGRRLVPGLVFTVEPVIGTTQNVEQTSDGVGFRTTDRSPTAQFEHTIAILPEAIEILTMPRIDIARHATEPPDIARMKLSDPC
jgi:methionyl aminopeptidase